MPYSQTVILLLFAACFNSCAIQRHNLEADEKMRPSEWFYMQRAYPEAQFNTANYLNALRQAEQSLHDRNNFFSGFNASWVPQGPKNIGGRMNCVAVHPSDSLIMLLGSASGGLFRTENGGKDWFPIFDSQNTLAIGDITFAPSAPNIVFVGTGDPNISAYPFLGSGIYKSTDGGKTFVYSGLAATKIISKVVVHPNNPNIVYAAAMGSPFERDENRGLYRSTDGGNTWTKIFYASAQAGIIDIATPLQNPSIIYISAWDRIRTNSESVSSGQNTKVYRTLDGGNTWNIVNGLPQTDNGRIGLAISPTSPSNIVAIVATVDGDLKGFYRSTNSGSTWTNIASDVMAQNIYNGMGWYFGKTFIAPNGDIYALGVDLWRYRNNIWENITEMADVHVDMHDMTHRGNSLWLATDGGAYTSTTNGNTWTDIEDIPVTQCYRISISPHAKGYYWVGTQDNGTIVGNKKVENKWVSVFGGDGFKTVFVPSAQKTFFIEQQEGNIWMTRDSGASFQNATLGIDVSDRRAWDMPYFISHFIGQKLYAGTNRVYRAGFLPQVNWQPISLDLTKGDTSRALHPVITALAESKFQEGIIYAGTSDGNAWIFQQNTWSKIIDELPNRYITSIRTSPTAQNAVFITHSGYKDNSNTPLIHRSSNRGKSWVPIKGDLPDLALNDIAILPKYQDSILFVATDGGVYATKNRGINWQRLGNNMPLVPVYELEIDTVNRLLVAATHGRSVMTYPLDSITYQAPSTVNISGKITLPTGKGLSRVQLLLEYGTRRQIIDADTSGFFSFNNLIPKGSSLKITPFRKDNSIGNGISASDLVAIQKHILAVQPFTDPLKTLASDANLTKSITASDLVLLRKVILTILDTMPQSWRFVPKSQDLPNPQAPFNAPESIIIPKLEATRNDLDFWGLKVGDVNNSASGF
jgi:photosystem II stability/assembly factor-like uncharacterized protein